MNEFFPWLIGVAGAVASWYCYRWGHDDGHAEGYEAGRVDAAVKAGGAVSPSAVGGPGAVPR